MQCICLYVDADITQDLEVSAASQQIPTIILTGKLTDATTNMEDANRLLKPPGLEKLEISKRNTKLRSTRMRAMRVVQSIGPFKHGQSISLIGAEEKGSVAVFLSPQDETDNRTYALTAYHVVSSSSTVERRVITPGGLDILTCLLDVVSDIHSRDTKNGELDFLMERWRTECGEYQHGHIGTNGNGWRSDCALILLREEWKGANGSWMENAAIK